MYHTWASVKGWVSAAPKRVAKIHGTWSIKTLRIIFLSSPGHDHPRLMSVGLIAQQLHWVNREPLHGTLRCTVKTRYRQTDIPAPLPRWMKTVSKSASMSRSRR